MLRLHLASPELADFESAAPDDHIKLFVPDGEDVAMRDYTPRAFDPAEGTLVVDFALHDAGPATAWALAAEPGDTLQIGGPRGSAIVPDDFDWYLLVGDETALPAIARRLEELRPGVPVIAVILVDGPEDRLPLPERDGLTTTWCLRDGGGKDETAALRAGIDAAGLPAGEGYVWIAAEATVAQSLRAHVVETLGHPLEWTKASGYWTAGATS